MLQACTRWVACWRSAAREDGHPWAGEPRILPRTQPGASIHRHQTIAGVFPAIVLLTPQDSYDLINLAPANGMVKGVSMLVTTRSGTIEEAIGEVIRSEAQSEGLSVSRIILFGSRARGDADDKSDWDVLVVLPHNLNRQQRLALFVRLSRALAQRLIPCDLVIRTEDEVTRESRQIGTTVRTALEEGIVL